MSLELGRRRYIEKQAAEATVAGIGGGFVGMIMTIAISLWRYFAAAALFFAVPGVLAPDVLAAVPAVPIDRTLESIRLADLRLATIGFRLATGNTLLCDVGQPGTGLLLHTLSQYVPGVRPDAARYFGFVGPVAVEGVVSGSPAAAAGVLAGDAVLALNATPLDQTMPPPGATATIDMLAQLDRRIAAFPPGAALRVTLLRNGKSITVELSPRRVCRSRFELLLDDQYEAQADGELVQVGSKFLDSYSDDQVAVIVAHELAHNILHHRARLEAAKVNFGLLAEIGKNGRLFRRTETEADQLGVVLLANAGYDPASAARFWRGPGARIDGGLFRARTHAGAASRAKITAAVATEISPATPRPIIPPLIATREQLLR